jgi:hypothetical protein
LLCDPAFQRPAIADISTSALRGSLETSTTLRAGNDWRKYAW